MSFLTKENEKQNMWNRMGLNYQGDLDALNRADYGSDDEYLDALVERRIKMDDPRYREIRRGYQQELEKRRQAEIKQAQAEAYRIARENARLTTKEREDLDAQATQRASADLYARRIGAKEFNDRKQRYFDELERKKLDDKAAGVGFSDWFRAEANRSRITAAGESKAAPSVGDTGGA